MLSIDKKCLHLMVVCLTYPKHMQVLVLYKWLVRDVSYIVLRMSLEDIFTPFGSFSAWLTPSTVLVLYKWQAHYMY
jgi:hypothetical protein